MRAATELELDRPLPCSPPAEGQLGLAYALGAYLAWGFIPLYFWLLRALPPVDVVAHRVAWSILFLAALLTIGREWGAVRTALASRRTMLSLAGSTVLIATNWLVFVWAVKQNQVLQASLGYFITPLVSILLGVTFLKERLRPVQAGTLLLAVVAVGVLTWGHGQLPEVLSKVVDGG